MPEKTGELSQDVCYALFIVYLEPRNPKSLAVEPLNFEEPQDFQNITAEHFEPVEPIEQVNPIETDEPVRPVEPNKAIEPVESVRPMHPKNLKSARNSAHFRHLEKSLHDRMCIH